MWCARSRCVGETKCLFRPCPWKRLWYVVASVACRAADWRTHPQCPGSPQGQAPLSGRAAHPDHLGWGIRYSAGQTQDWWPGLSFLSQYSDKHPHSWVPRQWRHKGTEASCWLPGNVSHLDDAGTTSLVFRWTPKQRQKNNTKQDGRKSAK